jgi:CRP-like cAMP-binding protein
MLEQMHRYAPFADLPEAELALAAPLFIPAEVKADIVLFRQDQKANRLFLIIAGQVALHYKPYDGPEMRLARVRAGGAVGWSAVTGAPVYTASAVASLPCELLVARGSDLRRLLLEHPDEGQHILARLATAVAPRWKGSQDQVEGLLSHSVLAF